jgi:lipopolysaccharide heptosyltransferase II
MKDIIGFKRILIINPFGIGDVLFTTPILRAIKDGYPDVYMGYLCNRRTKEILEDNPCIDVLYIYEKDEYRTECKKSKIRCVKKFIAFLRSIKNDKYDLVIDLSLGRSYNFFSWLIGIKKRVGFNYKRRGRFLTQKIDIDGYSGKHVVDFYLDLLKFLNINYKSRQLEVFTARQDIEWADNLLDKITSDRSSPIIIGLVPFGGASWGKSAYIKHWQEDKFIQLGKKISGDFNAVLLVFGDHFEKNACDRIADKIGLEAVSVAGQISLKQFVALLRRCRIVITNDGGPLHLAVAAGAKTVSIFGPVDERVYGPYPKTNDHIVIKHDLDCRPCYHKFKMSHCDERKCLDEIDVDKVYMAIKELL